MKVTTWSTITGDRPVQEAAVEQWNKDYPDQQITQEFFDAAAYKPKLRTAVGAGNAPTFFYSWGGGILRSYVEAGGVLDLTPFRTENPEIFDRYIPAALENNVIDGKTYGIPANKVNPTVFYYNKDLFEQAGVEPPETWDEFLDLIPVFKDRGIAPVALGGQTRWPELIYLEYLQNRLGGDEVFERVLDGEEGAWSDPAMIEAATMIQDLVKAGAFQEGYASTASDSGSELALVYTGKAAMCISISSQYQVIKKAVPDFVSDGHLGWFTFPELTSGKGDPTFLVGTPANSYVISSTATQAEQDAALKYMTESVLNDTWINGVIEAGGVPPLTDVRPLLEEREDKDFLLFIYDEVSEASTFQLSWDQSLEPDQVEALLSNVEQLFLLSITPEQFAENMNATI